MNSCVFAASMFSANKSTETLNETGVTADQHQEQLQFTPVQITGPSVKSGGSSCRMLKLYEKFHWKEPQTHSVFNPEVLNNVLFPALRVCEFSVSGGETFLLISCHLNFTTTGRFFSLCFTSSRRTETRTCRQ